MKLRLNVVKNPFALFSRFYSRHSSSKSFVSINQLLPILPESINTSATVRHCATIIVKLTEKLNPGQVPIITADQLMNDFGNKFSGYNHMNLAILFG